jgi:hypothetical protein
MADHVSPSEFEKIPLAVIIAEPLKAAVSAQKEAAKATIDFVHSMMNETGQGDAKTLVPQSVFFKTKMGLENNTVREVTVEAPLLSLVPVPHLRIDSLTINFKYQIAETLVEKKENAAGAELEARTGALLSPWASGSFKGSVSSKSSEEATMNRSGSLEVTVHASESPIPEGLAKILSMLSNAFDIKPV